MVTDLPFWEQPEHVERFAAREPDHRLIEILDGLESPSEMRVLDLGCAGGRNAVLLADHGCSVWGLDASQAMVEKTRGRLASLIGEEMAARRVVEGSMSELGRYEDGFFHLVVALGIYHNAASRTEWEKALSESARVLAPGGLLLVAAFTPETDLTGAGVLPVAGEPLVYEGFPSGRALLVTAEKLDAALETRGLLPVVPSETVITPTDTGRRVTINALYRKRG